MSAATTAYAMCVPDEHYVKIEEMVKADDNGHIYLGDKSGCTVKFYLLDGKLMSEKEETDGNKLVQRVITMTDVKKLQESQIPMADKIATKLKEDFPEQDEETIKAHSEVLAEANNSIKNLVASGVPMALAKEIIMSIMDGTKEWTEDLIVEYIKEKTSEIENNEIITEEIKSTVEQSRQMSFGDYLNNGKLNVAGIIVTDLTLSTPDDKPDIIVNSDSMLQLLKKVQSLETYVKLLQQTYEIRNTQTNRVITLQTIQADLGLQ